MNHENPLAALGKGALAGVVGTAAMTVAVAVGPKLMEQLGLDPPPTPTAPDGNLAHVELAEKIAHAALHTDPDDAEKEAGGQVLHWAYGIGWGAAYGLLQSRLRLPHTLHGLALGVILGALASTVVPALGLATPPQQRTPGQHAMQFGITLLYGWVASSVFHRLTGGRA